jgi:golgin subfamily B member 1
VVSYGAPAWGVDFNDVVSTSFKRLGQSELLPRYIFAESLYARRRVLEIGAVASTLGQSARFLSTRGARVVVAADSDLQAIQEAQAKLSGPNLRFRPPVFDDFEAGSFDLVMVADLAPYVVAAELLKDLARLVAKGGYLMGGLRNPAGLALSNVIDPEEATPTPTYGQLLDALTVHFKSVEVATQSPVLGYQLAFDRGEGLQVDGSLAGNSEAAYFIVVAGQEAARSFDPTWVQLPPEPLAFTGGRLEDFSTRARDWRERSERMKDALQKKTVELETRQADLRETSGQLEATKEAVARLTAQLESHRDRPEALRDREDLAQRVRRLEAELTVLRERAIDAEGRATAAKAEHDALQRAQKDAAITTLAAQEQIRLERARREEVATQLEDARTRLARAYEELKKAQEDVITERLERERTLAAAERARESMSSTEADLEAARQRELALADARTQSLLAIEGLEHSLAEARAQVASMRDESSRKEAERLSLARSFEVESTHRRDLEKELQREVTKARELEQALAERQTAITGLETELQSAASSHARALRDIETLASSERTWRELAGQYEQRLTETSANVQQLSDQLVQVGAEKEGEVARGRRLERDLETALTAERSTREQADVLGTDLRRQIEELTQDRERLIEERDDLRGAVDDLRMARSGEQQHAAELEDRNAGLAGAVSKLEGEVAQVRQEHEELVQRAAQQQRTLQGVIVDRETALSSERVQSDALRLQVVGLDAEISRLGSLLREGQKRVDEARASLESQSKEREIELANSMAARERIELLDVALGRATDALAETSTTLEATRSEKSELQHRLDEAMLRATGLSEHVENLQRAAVAANETIAAATSERLELDQRFSSLKEAAELSANQVADLEGRVARALAQLQEQEERSNQQQADLERERTASEAQRLSGESLQRELLQTRDALERITLAFNESQTALEAATATVVQRDKDVALLVEEREALSGSVSEREGALAGALKSTKDLEQVRDALTAELASREQQVSELTASVVELRGSLERLSTEHDEVHGRLSAERDALSLELSESRRQAGALTEELAHLSAELEEGAIVREQIVHLRDAALAERQALEQVLASRTEELAKSVEVREQVRETAETERRTLEAALAVRSAENERLTALHQEVSAMLSERTLALDEIRKTLEARESDWEQARVSLLESHRRELEARQVELEAQLTAARAEHERVIEQRIEASEFKLNELERQRDDVKASLEQASATAAAERAEAAARIEALRAELEQARAEVEKGHSQARGHQAGKHALQLELDRSRIELDQLRTSLAQAGGESSAIAEARAQLEAEVERLRQRVPELEGEITTLSAGQAELALLRERVPGLEQLLAEVTQRAASEAETGQTLAGSLSSAQADLQVLRERISVLEVSRAEADAHASAFEQQVLDSEARAEQLAASLAQYEDERPAMSTEIVELRNKVDELERQLAEAGLASPQSDADVELLRRRLPELEAEVEVARGQARGDIEAAVTARRQAEELLLALRVKYGELQHELETTKQRVEQSKAGVPELREQVTELTAENELLESERERLAEAVEVLEGRLKEADQLKDRLLRTETDLELTRKVLLEQARRDLETSLMTRAQETLAVPDISELEEESVTAVNLIPGLAALMKQPTEKAPPEPPVSPPLPRTDPEVFELELADDDAEEILLLDEETGENGTKGNGKK